MAKGRVRGDANHLDRFQASLGAAEMAADLVGKWLKQHPTQS